MVQIKYYNILFTLFYETEIDKMKIGFLLDRIKNGEALKQKDIICWCQRQHIKYKSKFQYRKDYPVRANLWNWYSFVRGKLQYEKITT